MMKKRRGRSSETHPLVIVARATATWHPPNSHRLSHLGYNSQACNTSEWIGNKKWGKG